MRILPALKRIIGPAKRAVPPRPADSTLQIDRRRAIWIIGATLLGACTPKFTVEVEHPPAANNAPFTDMQSALETIFSSQPKVLAFGEIHKRNMPGRYPSATMHFANEILPFLADRGVKDLVFEPLPDDPAIEAELQIFMARGTLGADTPGINLWIQGDDHCAKLRVLEVAREKGVTVHGGNMSMTECPDPVAIPQMYQADPERVGGMVREHTLAWIQRLLEEEKSVASFNGLIHNDYAPVENYRMQSFGDELYAQLGNGYAEVDLVVPEQGLRYPAEVNYPGWENVVPIAGKVTLIDQRPRFLMIFPRSSNATIHGPEEGMTCPI